MRTLVAIVICLVLGVVAVGACAALAADAQDVPFRNMKVFPVTHPDCKGFAAISERVTQYRLYYIANDDSLEVFQINPQQLYPCSIAALVLSPDKDRVVFLSEGEGHPVLSVYRMKELLKFADDTRRFDPWDKELERATSPSAMQLDPYPGVCDAPKWVDNNTIQFLANGVDLRSFDKKERRGKAWDNSDHSIRTWTWNLLKDDFSLVSTDTKSNHEGVPAGPKNNLKRKADK